MNRPVVLVIGPSPPPYNGMSVATELLEKAMEDGIDYLRLDTADRRGLSNIGKLEARNLLLAVRHGTKCLWLLLSRRPQVVYVPIAQAWLPFLRDCLFLIPAKLLRRRVIVHLHGGYFGNFYRDTSQFTRWIIRYALGGVACAIVLGRNVKGIFEGIIPAERIRVIPNGVPELRTRGTERERAVGRRTLLFLSTLMADKGFLDVLKVLPAARSRLGELRAIFAGEWFTREDKEAAERLVDEFQLGQNVEFVGPVGPTEKLELLESSDVLVFPTKYPFEGHPYVILEAMRAGLPVISTTWACIPETIQDGVNGFLVSPGDTNELAEKICLLLENEDLRKRMGRASRERYLAEFTFEKFAQRMRGVFGEVLEEGQLSYKGGVRGVSQGERFLTDRGRPR